MTLASVTEGLALQSALKRKEAGGSFIKVQMSKRRLRWEGGTGQTPHSGSEPRVPFCLPSWGPGRRLRCLEGAYPVPGLL